MFNPSPPYSQFVRPQYHSNAHSLPTNNGQAMGPPTWQIAMNGQLTSSQFNVSPPQMFPAMAQSSPAPSHGHPVAGPTSLSRQGLFTTPPRQTPEMTNHWLQSPSSQYAQAGTLAQQYRAPYDSPISMASPAMNLPQTQGAVPIFQYNFNPNQQYGSAMMSSPAAQYTRLGGQPLYQPPASTMTSPSPLRQNLGDMSTPTKRPHAQYEASMAPPPRKRVRSDPEITASMLQLLATNASGGSRGGNVRGTVAPNLQPAELGNGANRRYFSDPTSNSSFMQQGLSNLTNFPFSHHPTLPVATASTSCLTAAPLAQTPFTTATAAPMRHNPTPLPSTPGMTVPVGTNSLVSTQTNGPANGITPLATNPLIATHTTSPSQATTPLAPTLTASIPNAQAPVAITQIMATPRITSPSIPNLSLVNAQAAGTAWSHPVQRLSPQRRLGIAISGSTSSGKTTLAYLLAAVFSGTASLVQGLGPSNSKGKEREGICMTKTMIVHQDDFFRPKHECPNVNWGEICPSQGLNSETDVSAIHRNAQWAQAYESNVGINPNQIWDANSHQYPEQPMPQPVVPQKEGLNTDCREAIDWERLQTRLCSGAIDSKNNVMDVYEERKKVYECTKNIDPKVMLTLQNRVRRLVFEQSQLNSKAQFKGRSVVGGKLRDLLLIDGFLLFLLDNENCVGTQALMRDCEVNLFLPTSKEAAKRRRFQRPEYRDEPIGGRLPEQTWKTEDYFDQVAWKEYEKEHAWIFQRNDVEDKSLFLSMQSGEHRISVTPEMNASIQKTLIWAVEMILMSLLYSETEARNNFVQHHKSLQQEEDRTLGSMARSGTPNSAFFRSKAGEMLVTTAPASNHRT